MAGQINPYLLFNPKVMSHPDILEFFGRIDDRRADTVFKTFTGKLQKSGIELFGFHLCLRRLYAERGRLEREASFRGGR